jgi:PAS domain S-box-containing protein
MMLEALDGLQAIVAGMILVLTLVGLWRTTNMTKSIKWVWRKTFGATRHSLNIILSELTPNGGGSMKDVLNEVRENQEDYYALVSARLDADHQAVVITDAEGKVTNISRAFQEYTGMTQDMMEGDGWINLIHPDDRIAVAEQWHHVVKDGREMSVDQRYIRPDNGKVLHVHIKVYRQRDTKGKIRGFLAVIHPLETTKMCPYSVDPEICAHALNKQWDCEYSSSKNT